ncbi:biosynthetic arginine decarboxylase [Kaarinaea lacus]
MTHWTIEDTRQAYNIAHWGDGYFDINAKGHLVVLPNADTSSAVDLYQLVDEINDAGLSLPVLVRFTDILHHRIRHLHNAFERAMEQKHYQGHYVAVYPIKVNQQFNVVDEIVKHQQHAVGLEAGSKTELMAVLALSTPNQNVIVCNGYKDREYIRLALIGRRLGHKIYIVIEKMTELELVIQESKNINIEPLLGIRARLSTVGSSKWQNTGGEKSKFGLSANQIIVVLDRLKATGLLPSLRLLHYHLGSQIANIDDVEQGMTECSRYFAELHRLGAPIDVVDVGGGLSVDYDGTQSRNYFSMNYAIEDYAEHIVDHLQQTATALQLPQPDIFTESGRAMTAHHAVLITNVIDVEQSHQDDISIAQIQPQNENTKSLSLLIEQLNLPSSRPIEILNKTKQQLLNIQKQFAAGAVSIEEKAACEKMFYLICHQIRQQLKPSSRAHREALDELNEKLADKYFCNFSLFQSLPDIWAIGQVFPIVPLHKLDQQPTRRGSLHDITCDSDGRIDLYVDGDGVESSLPLHAVNQGSHYYLGVCLVGAYQEILGDMHNLFGDTNSVSVVQSNDGYQLEQVRRGDSTDYILNHIHFDPDHMLTAYKDQLKQANINKDEYIHFLEELEQGLTGYTYLED